MFYNIFSRRWFRSTNAGCVWGSFFFFIQLDSARSAICSEILPPVADALDIYVPKRPPVRPPGYLK